jgi:hypothetical protein
MRSEGLSWGLCRYATATKRRQAGAGNTSSSTVPPCQRPAAVLWESYTRLNGRENSRKRGRGGGASASARRGAACGRAGGLGGGWDRDERGGGVALGAGDHVRESLRIRDVLEQRLLAQAPPRWRRAEQPAAAATLSARARGAARRGAAEQDAWGGRGTRGPCGSSVAAAGGVEYCCVQRPPRPRRR